MRAACEIYANPDPNPNPNQGKKRIMRAAYEIHAGPMNFKYYMHHEVDEKQKCVTFHLDYDRCAAPEPQAAPEPDPDLKPNPELPARLA